MRKQSTFDGRFVKQTVNFVVYQGQIGRRVYTIYLPKEDFSHDVYPALITMHCNSEPVPDKRDEVIKGQKEHIKRLVGEITRIQARAREVANILRGI